MHLAVVFQCWDVHVYMAREDCGSHVQLGAAKVHMGDCRYGIVYS